MSPPQVHAIQKLEWQWQSPPWILPAYFAFSILATLLQFSIFYAPQFFGKIVPFTSWIGLSPYLGTLFFVIVAMFTQCRFMSIEIAKGLACFAPFGFLWIFLRAGREDFGNPYLMFSPFQPLITIGLPLFWAALLNSPQMKRWVNEGKTG